MYLYKEENNPSLTEGGIKKVDLAMVEINYEH